MLNTEKRCRALGKKPQEPDYVASLVLDSTPFLHEALGALFAKQKIWTSMAAVFCHQTPKVNFRGMQKSSCELGDLLIVHAHTTSSGSTSRNALLYQAKISRNQPHIVAQSERDQLRLYTDWPEFGYVKSPPLTGQKRAVSPSQPHQGAQYLLIDGRPLSNPHSSLRRPWGAFPLRSCMADECLNAHNDFPSEFLDFLLLRSGRSFGDRRASSGKANWSALVWDLLEVGLNNAFNRKNSGRTSSPRHAGADLKELDGCSFIAPGSSQPGGIVSSILGPDKISFLFSNRMDEPPDDARLDSEGESQSRGVSLVIIETTQVEDGIPQTMGANCG